MFIERVRKGHFEGIFKANTHPSSYYTVPQEGMSFRDVQFVTPLPSEGLSKTDEETMKEWLVNYRPVRQRTVRSETTKDKAGAKA